MYGLNNGTVYIFSSISPSRGYSDLDKIKYITNIPIAKAVRESCSFPGVFSPCEYQEEQLADGGIRENVPWKELKANGVEKVISIVFPKEVKYKKCKNIVDVIGNSIDYMSRELSNYELDGADYLLKIEIPRISLLDTSKLEYCYKRGYEETKRKMKEIRKILLSDYIQNL